MIQPAFPMISTGRIHAFPLIRAKVRRIQAVDRVQRQVARFYGLRPSDMVSARRSRIIAHPRQVAMYLAKELTPQSLPEIGRRFGHRDHTTVMHAIRAVEARMAADDEMRADVDLLRARLAG